MFLLCDRHFVKEKLVALLSLCKMPLFKGTVIAEEYL